MSVRLNIVMSQSTGNAPQASEVEGELVARLIGAPGFDLTLVGALERWQTSSTDQLALEGLSGDFALLTWQPLETAFQELADHGIVCQRAPHTLDAQCAPPSGGRRVYGVELERWSPDQIFAGLQRLLQARRTPTVSIGIGGLQGPTPIQPNSTQANSTQSQPRAVSPAASPHSGSTPSATVRDQPGPLTDLVNSESSPRSPARPSKRRDDRGELGERRQSPASEDALNSLVDDLNALDI